MKNFTFYLALILCLFVSKIFAQDTFEDRIKIISSKIESITKQEKAALKIEVEAVNNQLINGTITKEEADAKKKKLAEARAINIESKVAAAEDEIKTLVQEKVDGKIKERDTTRTFKFEWSSKRDTLKKAGGEARTTSQFVFALGVNNLITGGKSEDMGSSFYEWGITYNTRIIKSNNFLHAKYGLSLMYNNLRPTDNRYFVIDGNQTNLEVNPVAMKDSRFRNVYLVAPIHLEFDFSGNSIKNDKPYFKTHQKIRLGIGGYAGINIKSKQILKYDTTDFKSTEKTRGDFNVNNFIYGLSSYVGYRATSLYIKYDLNPIFKDNALAQNNVSLGLRFDFN